MNLYLISQDANTGWDTYDSAVVAAESEEAARTMSPSNGGLISDDSKWCWVSDPALVKAELIGVAREGSHAGVVCASFNAG